MAETSLWNSDVKWKSSKVAVHAYDPNSILFALDSDYLADSGLPVTKRVLYCRPTFHDQFKFLRERVIEKDALGYILGPPGTGKSMTSLAFVSVIQTLSPGWVVTWIHLYRDKAPVCVQFNGTSKKSCNLIDVKPETLMSVLDDVKEHHLVVLDG